MDLISDNLDEITSYTSDVCYNGYNKHYNTDFLAEENEI